MNQAIIIAIGIAVAASLGALGLSIYSIQSATDDPMKEMREDFARQYNELAVKLNATAEDARLASARAEARARLAALDIRNATQETYRGAADEVRDVREELGFAYKDAASETKESWMELDADLQKLEIQLRLRNIEGVQTLQRLLQKLKSGFQAGFCGTSTYGSCGTDNDCIPNGCSSQICSSVTEGEIVTTCEYRSCYDSAAFGLECGCVQKKCQWK